LKIDFSAGVSIYFHLIKSYFGHWLSSV